jgi:DNA-binding transcriptional LysR family regulator
VRSNTGEFVREAVLAGLGIGLLSTWDIASQLKSGALKVVLPQYRGGSSVAVHAVYPSREFMPAKVNVLIEFLADLYAPEPYWDKGLDLTKMSRMPTKASARRIGKASSSVMPAR